MLAPGGRLLIVDFAPHELEFLREQFAHERLGFAGPAGGAMAGRRGLEPLERDDAGCPTDGPHGQADGVAVAGRACRRRGAGAAKTGGTAQLEELA